jgi:lipopolysaccharide transport system ATP-binding protein
MISPDSKTEGTASEAVVRVRNLTVELPIYSAESRSFKQSLLSTEIGGRLLSMRHGPLRVGALTQLDLDLRPGERLGVMGHNGAGKTTLLRALAGVYPPTQGSVEVDGDVATMFDIGLGMDIEANGRENIFLLGYSRGLDPAHIRSKIDEIATFSGLGPYLELPVKTYSSGMASRLAFAVATSFQPDILLMDEWISTGDQDFMKKAEARLFELLEQSRVMVFASHSAELIERTCTRFMILSHGQIALQGPVSELQDAIQRTRATLEQSGEAAQ